MWMAGFSKVLPCGLLTLSGVFQSSNNHIDNFKLSVQPMILWCFKDSTYFNFQNRSIFKFETGKFRFTKGLKLLRKYYYLSKCFVYIRPS